MASTLSSRWELFVDDVLVDRVTNAKFTLNHPERKEVVFTADAPWEADNFANWSVVDDTQNGVVRIYGRPMHVARVHINAKYPQKPGIQAAAEAAGGKINALSLLESRDGGRHFERVMLGRCEFAGNTNNNIVSYPPMSQLPAAFIDTNPNCLPEQRYKAFGWEWQKLYALCSPDGIEWSLMQDEPLNLPGDFDSVNVAFWDPLEGCYRSFTRYYANMPKNATDDDVLGPKTTAIRSIQSSRSDDFIHWTAPVPNRYHDDATDTQLYTICTQPCPGAEHILIAFPARFVQHRIFDPAHPWPGAGDCLFMASRDGTTWTRYLESWVRPGLDPLNWTERNNYIAWGLVETSDSEWSLYISEHYRKRDIPVRIRRLAFAPRRFVSLNAPMAGGNVTTTALLFSGRQLRLNYSTSAAGSIRCEFQDEAGVSIPGFSLDDMQPLFGDALDGAVTWGTNDDISVLSGRPLKLHIELKDADLFAFQIAE